MNEIKTICGIDTLYYFCESNKNYDNLFLEVLDQIEFQKGRFEKRDIEFENNDINVILQNEYIFKYLGKAQGFYWLRDFREYFKIGFKDTKSNQGLNDIYVQLEANGIYTLGIKSLLELINDNLLKDFTTSYYPLTRVDINCFINYDFSFLTKEMFVTRKRNYATVSEIGTSNATQTIYVGKKPFLLRIYNKLEELKKSKKLPMMNQYFLNNGLSVDEPIFNIEFELHRTHLKQLEILTLDSLLENVNALFKISCDEIRMIELESISNNDKQHNKYKATTHPIWEQIKENYTFNEFHQTALPLERIKRAISIYDENKFELEFIYLIRKGVINNLPLNNEYIHSLYLKAKESLTQSHNKISSKKGYVDIKIDYPNKPSKTLRYLKESKEIIKPVNTISLNELGDYDLQVHYEKALKSKDDSEHHKDIYFIALKEMIKRGLLADYGDEL
ncbi:MAG: hypothetical protein PHF17_06655 [Arcobacteraceae bacterium]|nr:hypothetical protein [Arcobacteraceae bacterium]